MSRILDTGSIPQAYSIPQTLTYLIFFQGDACEVCETCLERCPMDALAIGVRNVMEVNLHRCIGCGLCVKTCQVKAINLEPKSENERLSPPETGMQTFMEIAERRKLPTAP
ncbi:MAG: 4Fe-4S dicluster domain-containing protein [Deltaproteobacteria bacterium]|nr:4Fe-4S dicluster domain-containing protein [Deltaproteobacteria bacterium]